MKRLFVISVCAVVMCLALSAGEKYAQATFPEQKYDFGQIREDKGPVTHTFELVNTGNKPLLIVEAVASCGCTTPKYSTKPIKPGKKGTIEVTYSPIGRPGAFIKTIRVKTTGREKVTILTIEGVTIPKPKKEE